MKIVRYFEGYDMLVDENVRGGGIGLKTPWGERVEGGR